ncbi:tyrosine--tRNA ligase [Candidatus Peregrinibacteria bacterium CG22_combo_CG10-13_8_21_14_all_44_10]|nr:MAG: tyrosine--tRNA ligase [Candidatus Peregrinibacteria bacterium CG2_30_44_17]PIP65930.1 MAG: tyrosine--tRNA ligase [Candidatus Peregrinibacteria bacterium CG22_combo_CG10-13_8_21_14_all_44_10]PIS04201.1 MAG: tyrosine--tRNA ligase [Candidatus Peregrinibacteria bacterium CG10_big_fil_rev_8_21_14_0_10_44_7]PIX79780.1 MAG: tyrosine--tRNA ligase [Candidatus Peregrinibacteria bacterium CG_4_10_14_3_um_filter_44_21]PJB88344.1 MAG: tyrosine--tRNA ligase [Candidatus Peregrinibacteria bacterium CG_
MTDDQFKSLLDKGTVDVIVRDDLETKLKSGKKLRIKLGIDPSGADLHIGHMVVIKKLKEFQDLGHHILLLFGNFTGQIGDPTGKTETRKPKTQEELEKNAEHYIDQVSKILDVDKIEVVWNADWLSPLTFADVIKLSAHFTVAQMLERDMFQDRIKNSQPISMHEFLYPLMQGYDSVALKADVEIGGTDQTFNLLAGRTLQKAYGQVPQNIITVPILEGLDGKIKMGKSEGNYIGVNEASNEMYGKVMSIPDNLILKYFELATNVTLEELDSLKSQIESGANPRDLKMRLGREIVALYHNESAAKAAEEEFVNVFRNKELPEEIEEVCLSTESWNVIDLISECKMVSSKSEGRRMIDGDAVKIDGDKVFSIEDNVTLSKEGKLIQVGKRRFLLVKLG